MSQIDSDQFVDSAQMLGSFVEDGHADLFFPRYRALDSGAWRVTVRMMPAMQGFWGRPYRMNGLIALFRPDSGYAAAWMSMTPYELESLEIGVRAARGYTVIFGLGMGWAALNAAARPVVTRVTVVERDPAVIALIEALGLVDQLPPEAREKIEVVEGDAYTWRPDAPVDSFQPDIWLPLSEPTRLDEVRRMQENVRADTVYFWGQEPELYRRLCKRADALVDTVDPADLAREIDAFGLPLVTPDGTADLARYAGMISAGARVWGRRPPEWWRA